MYHRDNSSTLKEEFGIFSVYLSKTSQGDLESKRCSLCHQMSQQRSWNEGWQNDTICERKRKRFPVAKSSGTTEDLMEQEAGKKHGTQRRCKELGREFVCANPVIRSFSEMDPKCPEIESARSRLSLVIRWPFGNSVCSSVAIAKDPGHSCDFLETIYIPMAIWKFNGLRWLLGQ